MAVAPRAIERPATWWTEFKALTVPVLSYWGISFVSIGLFSLFVIITEGFNSEDLLILSGFWAAALLGIMLGQVCAILRLRTALVVLIGIVAWTTILAAMIALAMLPVGFETFGVSVAMVWLLFPVFLPCGVWSLRVHMDFFAALMPVMFFSATIILISEWSGSVDQWFAGNKYAVWNVLSAPLLLIGVVLMLVYMVSREHHRLHRWQFSPYGPDQPMQRKKTTQYLRAAGGGCGTLAVVTVLAATLTLDAGVVAPYLWRTGESEGDHSGQGDQGDGESQDGDSQAGGQGQGGQGQGQGGGDGQGQGGQGQGQGGQGQGQGGDGQPPPSGGCSGNDSQSQQDGSGDGDGGDGSSASEPGAPMSPEQMKRVAKSAGTALFLLLFLLVLAIATLVVFGPPLRRTMLLQHLRRPLWPTPPTTRVRLAWRMVEVALADLGVRRRPGDSATLLARRAAAQLPAVVNLEPLHQAANLTDHVLFGLGIQPDEPEQAVRAADMAYMAIRSELTEWQKVWATYRLL
jgi:hypothetical protein